MEEKRYPIPEEECNTGMVCEPISAVASPTAISKDGITVVHDWIDDLDWDRFPTLGPTTIEEAIEEIDKFETDLKNGKVNWTSSEEFDKQLYEEFPWLR